MHLANRDRLHHAMLFQWKIGYISNFGYKEASYSNLQQLYLETKVEMVTVFLMKYCMQRLSTLSYIIQEVLKHVTTEIQITLMGIIYVKQK